MLGDSTLGLVAVLAMIVIPAAGYLLRKRGNERAARDLPMLALELGLTYVPSRYARALGHLKGTYRGYEVRVDPEEGRSISVRFARSPQLDLRSYASPFAPPFGWVTITSQDREFNRFFATRAAAPVLARSLAARATASRCLEPFRRGHARLVRALTVNADGVRCELELGNPPHLPPAAVRALLPACIEVAELVDSCATESGAAEPAAQLSDVLKDTGLT